MAGRGEGHRGPERGDRPHGERFGHLRHRQECVAETGTPPISTKWVDVDKGSRSRLVARDFRVKGESERSDLFAAMPPLEAKRTLLFVAVRRC